jgi:hypothetical protein
MLQVQADVFCSRLTALIECFKLILNPSNYMSGCRVHADFFDDNCPNCKYEYAELKGQILSSNDNSANGDNLDNRKKYKEFPEARAKRLYEELLLQFLNSPYNLTEVEAARKARSIIKKQCLIRGIPTWQWLK